MPKNTILSKNLTSRERAGYMDWYSYETCILTTLKIHDRACTVGNVTKYSPTTSAHQSKCGVRGAEITLDGVPKGTDGAELEELAAHYLYLQNGGVPQDKEDPNHDALTAVVGDALMEAALTTPPTA